MSCHGLGVHTCIDGSRYVGEFKRGVKHGLGQYHFRCGFSFLNLQFVSADALVVMLQNPLMLLEKDCVVNNVSQRSLISMCW